MTGTTVERSTIGDRTAVTRAALGVTVLVGAATFVVAYDDGGYSVASRSTLAVWVWWTIALALALGILPSTRPPRSALVPGSLLAALALWDLASVAWASDTEGAVLEFDRTALYLGIYVLVVLAARPRAVRHWIDGLTWGIVGVTGVALVARFFPGTFPGRGLAESLPGDAARLSFPVDYWNGLGTLIGLAVPLLLVSALAGGRARRLASIGVLPALGVALYLTSSRGAVLATLAGVVVFLAAHPERTSAVLATASGGVGSALAVALVSTRHHAVDGPFTSAAARSEGREAALAVIGVCVLTAIGYELLAGWAARRRPPLRLGRWFWAGSAAVLVAAAAVGVWRSYASFTALPPVTGTVVGTHLLSGGGSGRWQFWTAALDEFRRHPLLGGGAGSFEAWWTRHASFRYYVRDAHSLVVETLSELGVVGIALLASLLVSTVSIGVGRLRSAAAAERAPIAGLLGSLTVYAVGAAVDWMWEVTAVSAVAAVALGLLAGPATMSDQPGPSASTRRASRLASVLAFALVAAQLVVLVADVEVGASRADVRAGRLGAAKSAALVGTRITPWAASPYVQLALVDESRGDFMGAGRAIRNATSRSPGDWRLWLVRARIEDDLGNFASEAASRARARALNPRGLRPSSSVSST
jgi:O-antigen ligase